MATQFTDTELYECIKRELRLRRNVYPGRIASRMMTKEYAAKEIAMMEAVAKRFALMLGQGDLLDAQH